MVNDILKKYNSLRQKMGIFDADYKGCVNLQIKRLLRNFMNVHKRVAIYCYGYHTKMLMTDFISDLRNVICIVDQSLDNSDAGFLIIKENELEAYEIDGVIISTFKFKNEIKDTMKKNHPEIAVLDIYEELEKKRVHLTDEYYMTGPYHIYKRINRINNILNEKKDDNVDEYRELLKIYVLIKDFRQAIKIARMIFQKTKEQNDQKKLNDISEIYNLQLKMISQSSKKNILLLCFDGMRYSDFNSLNFEKTNNILKNKGRIYTRAYSYSTMTFESLVPAFSGNTDQRTKYFLKDVVDEEDCKFCKVAQKEGRKIYIYGDGYEYISGKLIEHTGRTQTIAEKLWDFTIDLFQNNNGIFYVHELYESHFSFPNPYTKGDMIAEGTALLFDFLPQNGCKLKTNYKKQLQDSLHYLDDTIAPFIKNLSCSMLFFADHGNLLLDKKIELKDIKLSYLTASEEWLRIPWIIVSEKTQKGNDNTLISLMDINDVVISLIENKEFIPLSRKYIKFGRSEIYNPDFKEIYKLVNCKYNGEAFEGFIFEDGYKLIVFSNGTKILYATNNDEVVEKKEILEKKNDEIKEQITIL